MTREEAITLLDELLLDPTRATLEEQVRGSAAELVAQIRDHPLSYSEKRPAGQHWYMGGLLVDVVLERPRHVDPAAIDDRPIDPLADDRRVQARVWVPDVTKEDAFAAQLVVERQLRDALGQA